MNDDYEKALYYTLWGQLDELLVLMERTDEDMLAKKIEQFLQSYYYANDDVTVVDTHDTLLDYIDHASHKELIIRL